MPEPVDTIAPATEERLDARTDEAVETLSRPLSGARSEPALVEGDLLVEDVSIDGMCGVY